MEPVNDPSVVSFLIEFIDPRARSMYFGTINRLRRRWLDEHSNMWRRYMPIEGQTERRIEGDGDPLAAPGPNTPTSAKNEVSPPNELDNRSADAQQLVHPAPPPTSSRDDEITIDGLLLVSERWVAAKLGINKRTLLRWHKGNFGVPRIKMGRRVFYEHDKLMGWLQRP
jgi:hypothetical protein